MPDLFKTDLEMELEKACKHLEFPFHEFRTDLLKELLDIGYFKGTVLQETRKYLIQKVNEYNNAKKSLAEGWNESFADVICEGIFAKKGSFYKQRFGEINNFIIDYKQIIENIEEVEKAYADNSVAEKLMVSCSDEGAASSALYLLCLGGNVRQFWLAKSYGKEFPQFAKYKKGEKLDAKEFVKDLIELLGA